MFCNHHASILLVVAKSAVRQNMVGSVVKPCRSKRLKGVLSTQTSGFSGASVEEKLGLQAEQRSDEPEVVLFQRGPGRDGLPRSGLFFSSLHTIYWIWYGFDFVPAINASPVADIHIDPMIPLVGTVFAAFIQLVFTSYPTRLVHKLTWRPTAQSLQLYTYSIPFIRPRTTPTVFPVGEIMLDASSSDTERILKEFGGNIGRFKGHLGISKPGGSWPPYLLDMREASDAPEPEILLEALLSPAGMTVGGAGAFQVRKTGSGEGKKKNRSRESSLKKIIRQRR
jgi:hypothetical protein